jgi:sarcosine oxidase subunit gamma
MAGFAESFRRRTPLYRVLDREAVRWSKAGDAAIADPRDHADAAGRLGLADLTPLPRLGFKGRGTIAAMQARGVAVEAAPNRAFRQADGGLCLVLAPGEVILLSNPAGEAARLAEMEADWRIEAEERTYPIPRRDSHAWLVVTGRDASSFFARICGVDLRLERFQDLSIAQTSLARLNAIITRADLGTTPAFHVLADSASAAYLLQCLRDAAGEFGGRLVGLSVLRGLQASW